MIITLVNMSKTFTDEQVHPMVRAINRQIAEDFQPYWSLGATLRLEGKTGSSKPDKLALPELRGDAVLYLWDEPDVEGALGYHDMNAKGLPFGFVFTKLVEELGEQVSVTLSHEALELVADPLVNLLVAGPHPQENRVVFHWYEMSDPVQAESYLIDGVAVSNFVLPLYFTPEAELGSRNDFLGKAYAGKTLASFGINPGGYIGFFDPTKNEHVTYGLKGDKLAMKRLEVKRRNTSSRSMYRKNIWPREAVLDQAPPSRGRARGVPPAERTGELYERIG